MRGSDADGEPRRCRGSPSSSSHGVLRREKGGGLKRGGLKEGEGGARGGRMNECTAAVSHQFPRGSEFPPCTGHRSALPNTPCRRGGGVCGCADLPAPCAQVRQAQVHEDSGRRCPGPAPPPGRVVAAARRPARLRPVEGWRGRGGGGGGRRGRSCSAFLGRRRARSDAQSCWRLKLQKDGGGANHQSGHASHADVASSDRDAAERAATLAPSRPPCTHLSLPLDRRGPPRRIGRVHRPTMAGRETRLSSARPPPSRRPGHRPAHVREATVRPAAGPPFSPTPPT